jgi:hypothetical protein
MSGNAGNNAASSGDVSNSNSAPAGLPPLLGEWNVEMADRAPGTLQHCFQELRRIFARIKAREGETNSRIEPEPHRFMEEQPPTELPPVNEHYRDYLERFLPSPPPVLLMPTAQPPRSSRPVAAPVTHTYEATVSFGDLCDFSRRYMNNHCSFASYQHPREHVVYLLDDDATSFRAGLIDAAGSWLNQSTALLWGQGQGQLFDPTWGIWRAYQESVPYGFKWQSCTNSVLSAQRVAGSPDRWRIECTPPDHRRKCGYMSIWSDLGVSMQEILPVEAVKTPEPAVEDHYGEEPEWPSIEQTLARPSSGC